tara:strand:- start:613 stop:1803 length:1191 start_codon:yes stop_codon:yes gene_type:complete
MKTIEHVCLKGKKVLIRVDFNVPINENLEISDDTRMVAAIPTIQKVVNDGGRAIIISHLGRPKNGFEEKYSLKHTVNHLSILLDKRVQFSNDCIGKKTLDLISKMSDGDVIVLENLRFYNEEKSGDEYFSKKLAELADVYVNDAFGVAHRAHASTAIITKFFTKNKYFGLLLSKEISVLKNVLKKCDRPFTAIIGGSKITGKIDVIKSLFKKVDNLIVGGGMAYTFIESMGGSVGKSLVEKDKLTLAKQLIKEAKKNNVNLILPIDSLNADSFSDDSKTTQSDIFMIDENYMGLDLGDRSVAKFCRIIKSSKTIIWNGPMGVFEMKSFERGTREIGEAICWATKNGAFSLVGGGDSIAALQKFKLEKRVSYVSTGGGAMLEFLEGKDLPGIKAVRY